MITYEYKIVTIEVTEDQKQLVDMDMIKTGDPEALVLSVINEEGAEGWEALYPFSFPVVWFRRTKNSRKKA